MTLSDLGALGEFMGSLLTLATLAYLAVQVRQNTAQQKREELVSVQHGQNTVVAEFQDPALARAYVRTACDQNPSNAEALRAQNWVIQYLNHFQIVQDLYENGTLDEARYGLWSGFAVAVVAPPGIRRWWEHENGKLGFHEGVRDMIDARLRDTRNPPVPITELWPAWDADGWDFDDADRGDAG